MTWTFTDDHMGPTEDGRTLTEKVIRRPAGVPLDGWYGIASQVCKVMDSTDMALKFAYSNRPVAVDHEPPRYEGPEWHTTGQPFPHKEQP